VELGDEDFSAGALSFFSPALFSDLSPALFSDLSPALFSDSLAFFRDSDG
jgi:hypothetical protein